MNTTVTDPAILAPLEPSNFQFEAITSSNGKTHAAFTSNFNSNDAAFIHLKAIASGNSFAQSICDSWLKASSRGWNFSPAQTFWLHRLATPAAKPSHGETKQLEIDTAGIAGLLEKAEANLKFPKFTISSPDGSTEIKVAKASPRSKFFGSFTVASPVFGEGFFGTLKDGKFSPARQCTDEVLALLVDFAADPEGIAAAHGHRTGSCCFCSKELSTKESLAAGFGPTCAQNFGLAWGNRKATK
jgi:hypothetical protein